MPSNYTSNYNLNQWEPGDAVLRTDFNADNEKLDAALTALSRQEAGKADQSALDAEAAARKALGDTVAAHAAAIAKLGNCMIETRSYRGGGTGGQSFTFSHQPILVIVAGNYTCMIMAYGNSKAATLSGGSSSAEASLSWSGHTLSWSDSGGCNTREMTYQVIALLDASK